MRVKPTYYPCPGCGSVMVYSPSKGKLSCQYCGSEEEIEISKEIKNFDIEEIISKDVSPRATQKEVQCPKCGAHYSFEEYQVSTLCKYCQTPAITDFNNPIKPTAIAPFKIEQKEAHDIFAKWIGSLWLAPNELKHVVDTKKKLTGFYLPYWLFDANTKSYYTGERGEAYYVTVERRRVIDGKEQIVQEQERRIRWYPVSGVVSRDFKDVSISASEVIPFSLLQSLRARYSEVLVGLNKKFFSGFDTREYTINPQVSYERAKSLMQDVIRIDVLNDIGGDEQRIHSIDTDYFDEKYKHTLFPIWSTKFKYKGKEYYYAIDGLSGEIVGERPYSYWKVTLLVISIVAFILMIVYWDQIVAYFQGH